MATAELSNAPVAFTIQPITYEITKAEIERVASAAMLLSVLDVNDKENLERCHKTRMQLRDMRLTIENKRKQLKADSLEYGRQVDGAAKELMAPIQAAEAHLIDQESIVQREQERIARANEEHRQKMIRSRLEMLSKFVFPGCQTFIADDVASLTPQEWEAVLANAHDQRAEYDQRERDRKAEQDRIAAANRIEAERLNAERAELDEKRQAIDAANKRIADAEAASAAREKAKADAIAEQDRVAAAAQEHLAAVAAEKVRVAALLPDHEKLLAVADLVAAIKLPPVSVNAANAATLVESALRNCAEDIRVVASDLVSANAV